MTEAELVEQVFSVFDRYWSVVQWWASISFSLILVAYFAACAYYLVHAFRRARSGADG